MESATLEANRVDDLIALVFEQFKRSLDLDVALDIVQFKTEEERNAIAKHPLLIALIRREVASFRENLMQGMFDLSHSDLDGVRLSAIKDLGKMLYSERFKEDTQVVKHTNADGGNLPTEITVRFISVNNES